MPQKQLAVPRELSAGLVPLNPSSFITSSRGGQRDQVVQPLLQDQVITSLLVVF